MPLTPVTSGVDIRRPRQRSSWWSPLLCATTCPLSAPRQPQCHECRSANWVRPKFRVPAACACRSARRQLRSPGTSPPPPCDTCPADCVTPPPPRPVRRSAKPVYSHFDRKVSRTTTVSRVNVRPRSPPENLWIPANKEHTSCLPSFQRSNQGQLNSDPSHGRIAVLQYVIFVIAHEDLYRTSGFHWTKTTPHVYSHFDAQNVHLPGVQYLSSWLCIWATSSSCVENQRK